MRGVWLLLVTLIVMVSIASCVPQDNLDFSADDVSSIEISEWDGGEVVAGIEDREFIEDLVKDLDSAETETTADLDFESPAYRVVFVGDGSRLLTLGYYERVMNLGVEGRYWNRAEQQFYAVERELPLDAAWLLDLTDPVLRPAGPVRLPSTVAARE